MTLPSPGLVAVVALVPLIALVLTACGGEDDDATAGDSATEASLTTDAPTSTTARPVTTAPGTTAPVTTATTIDLTAVPATIDDAYVQAVMDRFDALLQDAYATASAEGSFDGAFETKIRSVYGGPEADKVLGNLRRIGIEPFAEAPGRPTTTVLTVTTARRDCVFLTAERDLTPLSDEPYEQVQPYYLQLVAAEPSAGNAMPWVLARDVYFADGTTLEDQCA